MIKAEVAIRVAENNDPLLRLKITTVDRSTSPVTRESYDFTGATEVEFIIKDGVTSADDVVYDLTSGITIVLPATDGRVDVQVDAADVAEAKNRRYRLDVVKASKRETVMAGPFIVQNF